VNYIRWFYGDYLRDTIHLTWDEDLVYRRLLDAYYASDGSLPVDLEKLYAIVRADTAAKRKAVLKVVQEFFKRQNGKLSQKRADKEMREWRRVRRERITAAKQRWIQKSKRPRNLHTTCNASAFHVVSSPPPPPPPPIGSCLNSSLSQDQEIKPLDHIRANAVLCPVPVELWLKFVAHRKKLRRPLTEHARDLTWAKLQNLQQKGDDPVDVVNQSIEHGWIGVFPIRKEKSNGQSEDFAQARARRSQEAVDRVGERIENMAAEMAKHLPERRSH
jgi:uncharacterized protein YdaU (DUF1376 family)